MKDYNKKRIKFIITWGLPTSLIIYFFPVLLTGELQSPYYLIVVLLMLIIIASLSTLMYERPTYPEKNRKPSPFYVPHIDNMGEEVKSEIETMLKEIHPLIKLTDEKTFGDVVLEMPAYVEGSGLSATHYRKYRITFDTHYKKVRFDLSNTSMDPRLVLCITLITIGLGWQGHKIDFKKFIRD